VTGVARRLAIAALITATLAGAVPATASALDPTKAICSLTGLISSFAGKACSLASHPGRVIGAGKKLLGGHLGGALDSLTGSTVKKAATATVALTAIVTAVVGGARYALEKTAKVIGATTRPNLQSTWFSASYWRMAGVSALLTLPFLFAAAVQAMIRSDLAMLARAAFGYLPLGLLAVAVAAPLTTLLLAGSDELSTIVASASGHDSASFLDRASLVLGGITGGAGTLFVAFFVGLLTAAATITLWIELLIRDAAVYVIVLMLPLFFAALVWPARRIWAIRAVELLVALILSKFAIVAVLALGGAALGHTMIPAASFLTGATLVLLAAFSPWALLRLLPLHEVASAAVGGLRSHPGRALTLGDQRAHEGTDRAEPLTDELSDQMRDQAREGAATARWDDAPPTGDAQTRGRDGADSPEAASGAASGPGESVLPIAGVPSAPGDPHPATAAPPAMEGPDATGDPSPAAVDPGRAGGPAEESPPGIPSFWRAGNGTWILGPEEFESAPPAPPAPPAPSGPSGPSAPPETASDPTAEPSIGEDRDPTPPRPEPDGGRL
jgi:hypothetical protein